MEETQSEPLEEQEVPTIGMEKVIKQMSKQVEQLIHNQRSFELLKSLLVVLLFSLFLRLSFMLAIISIIMMSTSKSNEIIFDISMLYRSVCF